MIAELVREELRRVVLAVLRELEGDLLEQDEVRRPPEVVLQLRGGTLEGHAAVAVTRVVGDHAQRASERDVEQILIRLRRCFRVGRLDAPDRENGASTADEETEQRDGSMFG